MKLYDVTIQMKPLQQYFHIVLLVLHAVVTFASVVNGQLKPFKQSLFFVLLTLAKQILNLFHSCLYKTIM